MKANKLFFYRRINYNIKLKEETNISIKKVYELFRD